jgi:hypothetical protein
VTNISIQGLVTYLELYAKLLSHGTRFLIPDYRLLLQTEEHSGNPLYRSLQCFRIPGVDTVAVQRALDVRCVIEGEEGGGKRSIIREVFLNRVNYIHRHEAEGHTWTSWTSSNSSASARRSIAVLLKALLKSVIRR